MTPRNEIIDYLLRSGIADKCASYQSRYEKDPYLREEIRSEMWLWLLTYDEDKLSDAYENKHLNALITRYLQNQIFSKNSQFYYTHKRISDERQTRVDIKTLYDKEEIYDDE